MSPYERFNLQILKRYYESFHFFLFKSRKYYPNIKRSNFRCDGVEKYVYIIGTVVHRCQYLLRAITEYINSPFRCVLNLNACYSIR